MGDAALAARDAPEVQCRAGRTISVLTLVSRVMGFVRILVVSAVFGTSFLGATYQTANNVPNLIFELVAAGALSAVLVPTLVDKLRHDDAGRIAELAGGVLGVGLVTMAALTLIGVVAAEPIARLLFIADANAAARADKVALGAFFLRFFLPQMLLYVVAMVMTGVLQSYRRFVVPVLAPLFNNVVVIAVYVTYAIFFAGQVNAGSVSRPGALLLALGTTVGVAALALPQIPFVRRLGLQIRPRFAWRDPQVRRIARLGVWAIGWLGLNSLLLQVMVSLANNNDNVVPLQVAWAFFLLPYSMFAMALSTTAFPALSRYHAERDDRGFRNEAARLVSNVLFWAVPAAVVFAVLGGSIARFFRFGSMTATGADSVALYLQTFALAVPAYCVFLALTRIAYARHDTRGPTIGNGLGVLLGVGIMVGISITMDGPITFAVLGVGTALAYTVACIVVGLTHLRRRECLAVFANLWRSVVAAVPMAALMAVVAWALEGVAIDDRWRNMATLVVGGVGGLSVYLAVAKLLAVESLETIRGLGR